MTSYRRRAEVQEATYDGELILYHPQKRHSVSLNASAAAFWEALAWPHTASQLAELLHEAAPELLAEECAHRTETLLSALLSHDLLETVSTPASLNPPTT